MSSPRITYTPRLDATPEAELSTLANVYKYALNSASKNAAGVPSTPASSLRPDISQSNLR